MPGVEDTIFCKTVTQKQCWNIPYQGDFGSGTLSARKVVLIADACPQRRQSLAQTLNELPLEVLEAENTREATALIAEHGPDLLFLDSDLEDKGAVRLCRTLKQSGATQFLPVFFTARENTTDLELQAIESGADGFLGGSLHPQILRARVQGSLRHKARVESLDGSEAVLLSLAQSVESRDSGLGQHCERLALISSVMGLALGLPAEDIIALQRAGFLHDIGKVSIPDSVLFKAGPLTPAEWQIMQSHAERGERICRNLRSLSPVLPIIRHHHEKWNGSGYPDRLKEDEIPLLAQILQMADIYDALTTERSYKPAFTSEIAIDIMREEARKGWRNPQLTDKFSELVPVFSTASMPDPFRLSLQALAASLQEPVQRAQLM